MIVSTAVLVSILLVSRAPSALRLARKSTMGPDILFNRGVFVPFQLVRQSISRQGTCFLGYAPVIVDVEEPRSALMPTA